MIRVLILLLVLACEAPAMGQAPALPPAPAPATKPGAPLVTSSQAQQTLEILKDDKKRAALISTLETIARAQPPPPPARPLPGSLEPNGLAAQALFGLTGFFDHLSNQSRAAVGAFERSPQVWHGFTDLADDPGERRQLLDALWRFAVIAGAGLATEWVVRRSLRVPHRRLLGVAPAAERVAEDGEVGVEGPDAPDPDDDAGGAPDAARRRRRASAWTFLRRLPLGLARLALDLLPVMAFLGVAHVLLGTPLGGDYFVRSVVLALVDAYAVCNGVLCVARMMLSPDSARLRLLRLSDEAAAYLMRWLGRLTVAAVFGFALGTAGMLLGLSQEAHDAFLKLVSLLVHVMLIVIVLQRRQTIARRLRAPKGATGVFAALCNRLAAVWHIPAVFLLAATWLVWAVELPNGLSRLAHFTITTLAILLVARIVLIVLLGTLDRSARRRFGQADPRSPYEARLRAYAPLAHIVLTALVYLVAVLALFQAWGFRTFDWFTTNAGHRVLSSLSSIGITLALALLAWEWANISVQTRLDRLTQEQHLERSARLRTLLPLLRTSLLVIMLTVVGLMVLNDLGVNIAPLLAGAGVLGIAIGFGSQKLVQDVITGLFLLLENTMQVGDVVTAGGLSGVVEYLSIRSIRLRSEDGSMHVIPFSAVTTVTNMTRDFGQAVIEAQVSYEDDLDEVVAVMREIVAEMRAEPAWAAEIRDDLEVWGLDRFADSAIVVKARIRVGPFARWSVKREFNRRMKLRFDEHGIEIPYPHQQMVISQPFPLAGASKSAPPSVQPASPPRPSPEAADAKEAVAREAAGS